MSDEKEFKDIVDDVIKMVKQKEGSVLDFYQKVGKHQATISQWRAGRFVPNKADREHFLNVSSVYLTELTAQREKEKEEVKKIIDAIYAN